MKGKPLPKRKPSTVRFYMDADVLGLAKVISKIRPDVTYPGDPGGEIRRRVRPPCPITDTETTDLIWIPQVAQRDWTIITRDRNISRQPAERDTVIAYNAKLFVFIKPINKTFDLWYQLEVLMTRWRDIERLGEEPGPFIYNVHRTTVNKVWPAI